MVDRRKVFRPISSLDHCQRSSPSRISNTPRAGFEPAQNLISSFVEWFCEVDYFAKCQLNKKYDLYQLNQWNLLLTVSSE